MTKAQDKRFYKQDTKKYNVSKNKELLIWLEEEMKKGYHSFIDIKQLQELIDNIVSWYELKYPEHKMKFFEDMEILSEGMDIQQLIYRLPYRQRYLMECEYRSSGSSFGTIYNDKGEVIGEKPLLYMGIDSKGVEGDPFSVPPKLSNFLLHAYTDNGKIYVNPYYNYNKELKEYINIDNITLDEVLNLFEEKYTDELGFDELKKCIHDHNCDVELRKRILQLSALKLLYSNRTIPERGYERAIRFINEVNEKMGLNLTTEEIDSKIAEFEKENKEKKKTLEK